MSRYPGLANPALLQIRGQSPRFPLYSQTLSQIQSKWKLLERAVSFFLYFIISSILRGATSCSLSNLLGEIFDVIIQETPLQVEFLLVRNDDIVGLAVSINLSLKTSFESPIVVNV